MNVTLWGQNPLVISLITILYNSVKKDYTIPVVTFGFVMEISFVIENIMTYASNVLEHKNVLSYFSILLLKYTIVRIFTKVY